MPDDDDEHVLARSIAEPAAFAVVYRRHAGAVLRYMRRRLGDAAAEDATTEVFLRAFRQRAGYRPRHVTALPWLYWLAGLVIADLAGAEQRRLNVLQRLAAMAAGAPAESSRPGSDLTPDVARALLALSAPDREALLLVVWGELSYEEAALAVGVPIGTVRSRIARARKQLRAVICVAHASHDHPGDAHA
ncbi:MAG: sigma-70 family RNA polymerase sigma factor [Solirubrobacteraceae bacterium]|nr:sigma-70 family RNA polymerase sigma factor [Solirubrobacteraceae bacterium]